MNVKILIICEMNVFTKVMGCTQEDMVTVNMHDNLPFFLIFIF